MRAYLLIFLISAAATYLLTVVAREIAIRTGAVAKPRERDVHAEPVPYMGGLAMLGGLIAAYVVARQLPFLADSPLVLRDAGVVLISGAVICLLGIIDDIIELDALTKFGGQLLATAVLIGLQVRYFYVTRPDGIVVSLDATQAALLTGLMVLATVNAVNFIDGLDGLAAGVVGIGALAFFLFSYELTRLNNLVHASTAALLSVALAGACLGFLIHNWNPARLFMGDSGSMLIGLVLSGSAISLSGSFSGADLQEGSSFLPALMPLFLPLTILIVPLGDLVLAVFRRTRAGRSPFAPDKQHLHHRLLEIGHSQRRAVLIMWLWAALIAFGSVAASLYSGPVLWTTLAVALAITLVLTFVVPKIRGRTTDKLLDVPDQPAETP